ncbi:MAG: ATP-dependent Clp protease ATP-binding subunit [Oscillospiraceae bacterium]|nr:ATP-dependent Clp protease ATP-binding subunit [Oscillospiraceae bacterium]
MQLPICCKCQKRPASVFITKKEENGHTTDEGYCIVCASEMKLPPVEHALKQMGITPEAVRDMFDNFDAMRESNPEAWNEVQEGLSHGGAMPFLNGLFNNPEDSGGEEEQEPQSPAGEDAEEDDDEDGGPPSAPGRWSGGFPGMMPPFGMPGMPPMQGQAPPNSGGPNRPGGRPPKIKYLKNFCVNLTERAREGKLDACVGREDTLQRLIQILNRRQKNNPCLIGEPGVGKTAVVEGLAQRMANGEVPARLRGLELYMLDMTALVADTQFRGQFEGRVKGLVEEVKRLGNVILFIDEVHQIVGAGDRDGAMNAGNMLKPALSRGEIQVIGATTFSEYRKYIEKDSALERRFQPVSVSEPSIADATEILIGIKRYYEDYHNVIIPNEVARQAVLLSERYITDRFLPDKAIDLIDEASSSANLVNPAVEKLHTLEREEKTLISEREKMLAAPADGSDYERIAALRTRQMQILSEIDSIRRDNLPVLSVNDLARVIELWTKIPAANIEQEENKRLFELPSRLKSRVVGQDEAIDAVCDAIARSRLGVSTKRKPASFIFVGSTGVGKTELVKQLASDLFDDPESLIRFDMSEFMEKHTVSRLIGSPPGYVGYDDAGQLTEKIRRRPYSVILFDEIEKAHPDVLNIMLQILDDGRLTDAQGRNVNFCNTVIIMTTNAGSHNSSSSVGFNRTASEQSKEKSEKALRDFLRPEFINRVDEIIYFNKLSKENFAGIARIMLGELVAALSEKTIALTFEDSIVDYLVEHAYSETYGARNLRRYIQKNIEDAIAKDIVGKFGTRITAVAVSTDADGKVIITSM